jgi:hypothetical protein
VENNREKLAFLFDNSANKLYKSTCSMEFHSMSHRVLNTSLQRRATRINKHIGFGRAKEKDPFENLRFPLLFYGEFGEPTHE